MREYTYKFEDNRLINNRVFRDAIHGYIEVDNPTILALIDTKEFQRLRRIKQLGATYQVYQSAEHSRFTHSLGVYWIVRKMCDKGNIGGYLSDYDSLTAQCAGLLHDLGHGPFSHSFERAFSTNHEDYTIQIILGATEINKILREFDPDFPEKVASVIQKNHPNQILVQMISSQLDADRMDYLLRDSYFTGTTYGQFDLSRILRVMKVKDKRIVYKKSGVQAIENYILARYHMYWQVYYHPTSRSYEALFNSFALRLIDLYKDDFDLGDIRFLEPFLKGKTDIKHYLKLDESVMHYYFACFCESTDPILADLSSRLLNRRLFTYCDFQSQAQLRAIKQEYESRGYDSRYYIISDDVMKVPYFHYGNADEIGEILIVDGKELYSLPEVSEIVGAIVASKNNKNDHKVFFPKTKS